MRIEDCQVGMEVVFGRGNGEHTRGVVEKMNRVKAKVRTVETRGRTAAGTVWGVPYSMMEPTGTTHNIQPARNPADDSIQYSPFQSHTDRLILEAICAVYNELSPENLCCDGELPAHMVNRKRTDLNRKLNGLFKAFGRPVSETAAYDWSDKKREADNARRVNNA